MALQGHPRSLILASIERAYATSCWSSIVTLVLSETLQVSWEERPHPYSTLILGMFPMPIVMAPRSEDAKLIIRVITFELTQHIRPAYHDVTDGRTDGRLTIAIPRQQYVHRAVKTYKE